MYNVLAFQRQFDIREKNSGLADHRWTNHRANLTWVFPTASGIYFAGSPDASNVYGRRVNSDGIVEANFSPGVSLVDFSAAGSYVWYGNGTQTVTRLDSNFGSAVTHTVASATLRRVLAIGSTAFCVDSSGAGVGVSLADGSGGFSWRNTYAENWGSACTDGSHLFLSTLQFLTPKLRKIDAAGNLIWTVNSGFPTGGTPIMCDGNGDVWGYIGSLGTLRCLRSSDGTTLYGNYSSGYPNGPAICADASNLYFGAFDSGGTGLYSISAYNFTLTKQWEAVQRISPIAQIAVDGSYVYIVGSRGNF